VICCIRYKIRRTRRTCRKCD